MSKLHVNQIAAALKRRFTTLVCLSDIVGKSEEERHTTLLTRSLAAYVLCHLGAIANQDAAKAVVDGFDDNGIDAIHYDPYQKQLWLVQTKWIKSGDGQPELGDVKKFVGGVEDLVEMRFDHFNSKINALEPVIVQALEDAKTKLRLVLAYPGQPLSNHSNRELNDFLEKLNDTSELARITILTQSELHRAVAGETEGEPIKLEIGLKEWGLVREPYAAYYGQVAAEDIALWWKQYGTQLLAENLRNFLGQTDVNDSISRTLKTRAQDFWFFNNGVTILCKAIEKKPVGGSDRSSGCFECEGVSIINGAQTVGCIGNVAEQYPESLRQAGVLVRLISLKNAPQELAELITVAANNQNRIERRDFVSLDPIQENIRIELRVEGKTYVYRSGDEHLSSDQICNLEEATVALACAHRDVSLAVQAKREVGRFWESTSSPPYTSIFNDHLTGLKVWRCVGIYRFVETKLKAMQSGVSSRAKSILVHGNRFILHMVFQQIPIDDLNDPDYKFNLQETQLEQFIITAVQQTQNAVNQQFHDSMVHSLFKNVTKCRLLKTAIDGSK